MVEKGQEGGKNREWLSLKAFKFNINLNIYEKEREYISIYCPLSYLWIRLTRQEDR